MRAHVSDFKLQTSNFALLVSLLLSGSVFCGVSQAALRGGCSKVEITPPLGVLVEVGSEIRKNAGIEKLLIATVANDAIGYVCPSRAYDEGGYEPESGTSLAPGAGEIMVRESLALLGGVK